MALSFEDIRPLSSSEKMLASDFEAMIDRQLSLSGHDIDDRFILGSPPGFLGNRTRVLLEVRRRYRAVGWDAEVLPAEEGLQLFVPDALAEVPDAEQGTQPALLPRGAGYSSTARI